MHNSIIIIPIYGLSLNEYEIISLKQAFKVFKRENICFIMPQDGSTDFLRYVDNETYTIHYFPNPCFESIDSYNKLMLNRSFYKAFEKYEYMLIYQLDAFAFENCLEYFCSLNYDYIGAPWICGEIAYLSDYPKCCFVGNGGFSLRKIKSFQKVLGKLKYYKGENEDIFFSKMNGDSFNVAPINVALQFSFERQVRTCYQLNKEKLPFGCHAWFKYDLSFWIPFIEQYGYEIQNFSNQNQLDDFLISFYQYKGLKSILFKLGWLGYLHFITGTKKEKLLIWGRGYWGRIVCRILTINDVNVLGVIENKIIYKPYSEQEIMIMKETIKEDYIIIVSTEKYKNQVYCELEDMGVTYKKDYIYFEDIMQKQMWNKFYEELDNL